MLRGDADRARSDFRHALAAYLDILVLLLAAQEGTEGAMETCEPHSLKPVVEISSTTG